MTRTRFVALVIQWHSDIVEMLAAFGRTLSDSERHQLLYILLKYTRVASTLDTTIVANELLHRPNYLKRSGGIVRLLELNAQRVAYERKTFNSVPTVLRPPTIVEFTASDGRYYLAKLFTKEHFQQESAALNHCLGRSWLDHYLCATAKREVEIFSLREASTHRPVVTIEYKTRTKCIVQIKTYRNQLIERTAPFLSATMEAICFLWVGAAYDQDGVPYRRGVHDIADLQLLPRDCYLGYVTTVSASSRPPVMGRPP
jgi:PcfJ-like protein